MWSWAPCFISLGGGGGDGKKLGQWLKYVDKRTQARHSHLESFFRLIRQQDLNVHPSQALSDSLGMWREWRGEAAAGGDMASGTGRPHASGEDILTPSCFHWKTTSPAQSSAPAIREMTPGRKMLLWVEETGKKPAQIVFVFLRYVLPRDADHEGRKESFSLSTASRQTISCLWFLSFLKENRKDVPGITLVLCLFSCTLLNYPSPFPIQQGWQELSFRDPPY